MNIPSRFHPYRLSSGERVALLVLATVGLTLVAGVVVAGAAFGADTRDLVWDPAASQEYPDYIGYLSHLKVLAWSVGATVALLGASLVRAGDPTRGFFLAFGAFTAWLTLDDLFRGHENAGILTGSAWVEAGLVLVYGAVGTALLWRFRGFIAGTPLVLLGAAVLLFGTAIFVDMLEGVVLDGALLPGHHVIEDGFMFLGVLGWTSYLTIVVRHAVAGGPAPLEPAAPAPRVWPKATRERAGRIGSWAAR